MPWRFLLTLAAAALLALALGPACTLSEGEFLCEDAVSKLQQCCTGGGTYAQYQCRYSDGCGEQTPEIDADTASCIRKTACADLRNPGTCGLSTGVCK